jgi:ankyrin repeat protein
VQGNENTKTALMFAAQLNRSVEVVKLLIDQGADVNQATNR